MTWWIKLQSVSDVDLLYSVSYGDLLWKNYPRDLNGHRPASCKRFFVTAIEEHFGSTNEFSLTNLENGCNFQAWWIDQKMTYISRDTQSDFLTRNAFTANHWICAFKTRSMSYRRAQTFILTWNGIVIHGDSVCHHRKYRRRRVYPRHHLHLCLLHQNQTKHDTGRKIFQICRRG